VRRVTAAHRLFVDYALSTSSPMEPEGYLKLPAVIRSQKPTNPLTSNR
jgi:hypothetical protein